MLQDNDVQAVQELHEAYRLITEQLGRVIVGQQQVIEELLIAMFARGHCLLVGVPGLAKTLMIRTLADALSLELQPHPVHPRPDARRHHRHRGDPGGQAVGHAGVQVPQGADLRQRHPGRRDQPHAAEDAVGPAGGDAGVPDHGRRHAAPAGRAVLRPGHAEPDRARRDLSAARGPVGPLHVPRPGGLSQRGGGVPDRAADDGRRGGAGNADRSRRRRSWPCSGSSAACRRPTT